MRRYSGIVLAFYDRQVHLNFQIAYHEKGKCVKAKYWGLRIEPRFPPVVFVKGEIPGETVEK